MINSPASRGTPLEVPARTRTVRFGAFEADLKSGELRKHGLKIKLQDQPFQLLVLLLESSGEVVTREELRQKLWPAQTFVDFDVCVNAAIKRLRDALGDSAESPRYVETLPRRGYRFVASTQEVGNELAQRKSAETVTSDNGRDAVLSQAKQLATPNNTNQPEIDEPQTKTNRDRYAFALIASTMLLMLCLGFVLRRLWEPPQGKTDTAHIRSLACCR